MAGSKDEYGDYGSVPFSPSVAPTGLNSPKMSNQASPADFGAQVGQGLEKVGETATNVTNQFGGMIMETAANQAELGYIKSAGDLKAKFSQYEGLQAEAMRPQYEADLANLHQQFRSNLPLMAQKMFDSNTIRSLGNQTSEFANYAAGQVKSANLQSNDAIADASIAKAGNLATVLDPQQFGEASGTILHAASAVADIKGWSSQATGVDPETGKLTFGDSPQAQATKAQYDQYIADKQSKLYITAAKTISDNQGAAAAADWLQAHWSTMPDVAKVAANQYIAPKVKNETIAANVNDQNAKLDAGWGASQTATIPSSPTETPIPQKTPLDVINENEGKGYSKDNKGEVVNGINSLAYPKEFTEAKNILDTQGQAAADKYTDNFYRKNIIEKNGINNLPAATQSIVADSLVNQGGFGKNILAAAKAGATPQELIDMRRAEYQRLNNTGLPEYTSAFNGWNTRLDKLQQRISGGGQGTPQGQAYANKAEYIEAHRDDYVQGARQSYLDTHPNDYYGAQLQENRATAEYNKQLAIQKGKLKSDTDTIEKAIGGSMTKGVVPTTVTDLQAIPGIKDILDRVQREQGDFYNTIDTRLVKASHGELSRNSPNAYDAILASLDNSGGHDRQSRIEYISKGLGSDNPGYNISQKDFNDAKPGIDLDSGPAEILANHMKEIATANGNIDGKGQDRAVQWYNQVMTAHKQNEALGDKKDKQFWQHVTDEYHPPSPGIMEQIKNLFGSNKQQSQIPTLTDKAQFDALPSGSSYIRDGQQYRKP